MNLVDDNNVMEAATALAELRKTHLEVLASASSSPSVVATSSFCAKKAPPSIPVTKGSAKFPMRMHTLLSDPSVHDAITWLPHGRSFVILRPDVLATRVLPLYFTPDGAKSGHVRYTSFTRKLNRWGFRQIAHGPDAGAFYHELFRRDDPEACRGMGCAKSRKSIKSDCARSVTSSSSTMSQTSNEIKPVVSAAVTVSTSGASLRSSLPLKKRHGLSSLQCAQGIPSNVEMKPNNTSLLTVKRAGSFDSSLSAEDTVSKDSDSAMERSMKNNTFVEQAKETLAYYFEQAKEAHNLVPRSISTRTVPSSTIMNDTVVSIAKLTAEEVAIASAKESLAHNFREQYKAYTLASLLKNTRMEMAARGMDIETMSASSTSSPMSTLSSLQGQVLVVQPNVTVVKNVATEPAQVYHCEAAMAAKNALYEAYKKAISVNHP